MKNVLKNAAITALFLTSNAAHNAAFAEEVDSMHNAHAVEIMHTAGNVLDGHSNDDLNYKEPLLLDAETMEYINLTDFYDNPRPVLGQYKEEVGFPKRLELDINDEHEALLNSFMENEANTSLSRNDIKEFLVLREVAKEYCLMYETGEELLEMAGSYENLENRYKGLLHQNETVVNGTALVLFSKFELSDNPVEAQKKIENLTTLLSELEGKQSSSSAALKDVSIDLVTNNVLQGYNVRRLARAITREHRDVGKQYHAKLVAEEKSEENLVATMSF